MGPFDLLRKKGTKPIQAQPLKIRKQITVTQAPSLAKSSDFESSSVHRQGSPVPGTAKDRLPVKPLSQARRSKKRPSPAQLRLESDSDDDSDREEDSELRKKIKLSAEPEVDTKRQIRSRKAFVADEDGRFLMVHAADIASLNTSTKYKAAFSQSPSTTVALQYPSASQTET